MSVALSVVEGRGAFLVSVTFHQQRWPAQGNCSVVEGKLCFPVLGVGLWVRAQAGLILP